MNKIPNRLINETSPYLLQHAYNPVDWYPWGEEAFQKAKKEKKLIFLSIGYSTCHWCHVMEKESFEDEETANILNQFFVSIKVDREELPDVDQIYMTAIQMMGIQGGWPLNLFLTPDLKPITGGTYFPPERRWGMPSFKEVLIRIHNLWEEKKENIIKVSEEITQLLQKEYKKPEDVNITLEIFSYYKDHFLQYFDKEYGGFLVNEKNKFPPSLNLFLILQMYKKFEDPSLLFMIEKTLQNMRKGGIYDQIGGGISRYSTDHQWLVPHFEKMLYDNALFCWINLETYKLTNNNFYLETALDVIQYLLRDLHDPEGGFYCAEDADSEGEEGKFYLWKKQEIIDILKDHITTKEIQKIIDFWGVTDQGNFEQKNILYQTHKDIDKELLNRVRKILLEYRNKRVRPHRDEKILTTWNALMISVLSYAYIITENKEFLNEAEKTLNFILNNLTSIKIEEIQKYEVEFIFYRSFSRVKNKISPYKGTLSDHASMGCAFFDLYKATRNLKYLEWSSLILNFIYKSYYNNGILYETKKSENFLIVQSSDFYDGVIPSGLSFTFRLIVHLYFFGINKNLCEDMIENILKIYAKIAIINPFSYSYFLMSIFKFFFLNQQIVFSCKNQEIVNNLLSIMKNYITSETIIGFILNEDKENPFFEKIELFKDKVTLTDSDYTIYFCENFSCKIPYKDLRELNLNKIF